MISGTKDNCGGQCLNSIRNLLPKRSKSLQEFTYEKNNENETRSGKMIIKRPTDGWKRIRNSLKLQKYKLPIKSGKISFQVTFSTINSVYTQIANRKHIDFLFQLKNIDNFSKELNRDIEEEIINMDQQLTQNHEPSNNMYLEMDE